MQFIHIFQLTAKELAANAHVSLELKAEGQD